MFSLSIKLDFYSYLKSRYQDPLVLCIGAEWVPGCKSANVPNLRELRRPKILPLRLFPERPALPILQFS